jgi:hypothetical protein
LLDAEGLRHLSDALASRDGVLANLQELNISFNPIPNSDPSLVSLRCARPHLMMSDSEE